MGMYTDIFIAASSLEEIGSSDNPDQYVAIEKINEWLRDNSFWDLLMIDHKTRIVPTSCFVGSYKAFNLDGFVEAVKAAPWQWRDMVQLFVRKEADDRGFKQVTL